MKKIISMLLVFCMMLSFSGGAFAATWTPGTDKTTVSAGEDVTVTLTLDEAIEGVAAITYSLKFNSNLFTLKSFDGAGETGVTMDISGLKGEGEEAYYDIFFAVINGDVMSYDMAAGKVCTLVFTAKEDITAESNAKFTLEFIEYLKLGDNGYEFPTLEAGAAAEITVSPEVKEPLPEKGYYVEIAEDTSISANENVSLSINVDSEEFETFNAYNIAVSFDNEVLSYTGDAEDIIDNEDGTLTIIGYGEDKDCGSGFDLNFTAIALGEAKVSITAANVDIDTMADTQDAPEAVIYTETATVTVSGYTVELGDDFSGKGTAAPGEDYSFSPVDPYYDIVPSATMGGKSVDVIGNDDGSFTIENVSGNLVITTASKTPKTYTVSVVGNAAADVVAEDTATYLTDYVFTVNEDGSSNYTIAVTVGKKSFVATRDGNSYTIPGAKVIGDIEISADKVSTAPTTTSISFVGEGSADVVGGTGQTANNGEDFSFSITKAESYDYTVTVNNETIAANEDGRYTIPAAMINGSPITVTVTKTAKSEMKIDVSEYITLDESMIWLVTASDVPEDMIPGYDGKAMFWSEKYNAYAYLVVSAEGRDNVLEAAKQAIAEVAAGTEAISYDMDINNTNVVDINDAQLVYNMYNAMYSSFDSTPVGRFLEADVNGDKVVDINDSAAIVNSIVNS